MTLDPGRRVLVTGATGFIGRHLVRRLVERGCEVSCLVRNGVLPSAHRGSVADDGAWSKCRRLIGDVTDRESIANAIAACRPAHVMHLAGVVRALDPDDFMRVNEGGVDRVAAACAACAEPPTLVVVSSVAAAGPWSTSEVGERRREPDAATPVSAYGRSKLAGEAAAARWALRVPITIVRPPIVFGPGDRAVREICRPIARWGVHPVCGRGDSRIALVHVDDLVEGVLLAAERGERMPSATTATAATQLGQGIYFMADDEQPTYAALGAMIAAALGKAAPRTLRTPASIMRLVAFTTEMIASARGRTAWLNRDKITEALAGSWVCSSAKAHTELGWVPAKSLADRLRETMQWYRAERWL